MSTRLKCGGHTLISVLMRPTGPPWHSVVAMQLLRDMEANYRHRLEAEVASLEAKLGGGGGGGGAAGGAHKPWWERHGNSKACFCGGNPQVGAAAESVDAVLGLVGVCRWQGCRGFALFPGAHQLRHVLPGCLG